MTEQDIRLNDEASQATKLLAGKTIRIVWRPRVGEVGIEFTDGTRFFADATGSVIEISIT